MHNVMIDCEVLVRGVLVPPVLFQPHQASRQLGSRPLELSRTLIHPWVSVGLSREPFSQWGSLGSEQCSSNWEVRTGCDPPHYWLVNHRSALWLADTGQCHWCGGGGTQCTGDCRPSRWCLDDGHWTCSLLAQFPSSLLVDLSEA